MENQTDKKVLEYLDIPEDGIDILKLQADKKECTMQELLRYIVSKYIKSHSN